MRVSFSTRIRQAWVLSSYSDICKSQIKYVKSIGGNIIPIEVDPTSGKIVSDVNYKVPLILKLTAALILFIYILKFATFGVNYYTETDNANKGIILSKLGAYFITAGTVMKTNRFLLKGKAKQLCGFMNCFTSFHRIGLGGLNTSLFKVLASQSPFVAVACPLLATLIMFQDVQAPIQLLWKTLTEHNISVDPNVKPFFYLAQGLLAAFEMWEMFVMYGMGCLLGYFAVFMTFAAIFNGTKTILALCKSSRRHALAESIVLYRRLQIFTGLSNDCVAHDYTMSLMTLIMTWTILATALVATPSVRGMMPLKEFLLIVGLLAELYTLCFFGYAFPGNANEISKTVRKLWRKLLMLEVGGRSHRINKRVVRSFQEVKIRFGSVNYFERTTSLAVVRFEVEQSASLMLVMK